MPDSVDAYCLGEFVLAKVDADAMANGGDVEDGLEGFNGGHVCSDTQCWWMDVWMDGIVQTNQQWEGKRERRSAHRNEIVARTRVWAGIETSRSVPSDEKNRPCVFPHLSLYLSLVMVVGVVLLSVPFLLYKRGDCSSVILFS